MSEMGPATKRNAQRLADAIREVATDLRHHRLADRAQQGEFADYYGKAACPITACFVLCRQYGLHTIADRLARGEFDACMDECNEYWRSPEGQETARMLPTGMRNALNLSVANDGDGTNDE
ncbi:MAG: hypothetical protein GDA50_04055 [Alphaproteobacteria bacterium GM202ARS2]|nr:hypothetical protein [Alphaproteobacteria bacterium GM202ARS2]